jgi:hypothetical protein
MRMMQRWHILTDRGVESGSCGNNGVFSAAISSTETGDIRCGELRLVYCGSVKTVFC